MSEAKQRRLAILKKIDAWEKERCATCSGEYASKITQCQCEAAVEIRKLGVQFEAISKETRQKRIKHLLHTLKKNGLSVDVYDELKSFDVQDKQIIRNQGIDTYTFYDWKASVGKMKERRFTVNAETKAARKPRKPANRKKRDIEKKYVDIAEANGIDLKTLERRVFDEKWDLKRATTQPIRAKKRKERVTV